jgi:plastocyanin
VERQQLAQRYLDGQMGRRVFLRRLVGLGVALPAAIAYADLLKADPAAATAYDFYVYVQDSFSPTSVTLANVGQIVEWGFQDSIYTHTATDPSRVVNSGPKTPWNVYDGQMSFSGTYRYRCTETTHAPMNGTVKVPMSVDPAFGPLGTSFTLGWSQISGLSEYSFDVQKKRPTDSTWKPLITGTSDRGIIFTPRSKGIFSFRSRARRTATGKTSGWSPVITITVT